MNLYVGCSPGIGKTTLAKKNDMFVDLDSTINPYRIIMLDKKKEFAGNLLNIDNKIILFNVNPKFKETKSILNDEIKQYIKTKNYFFLNIENVVEDLKARLKKREMLRNTFNGLKKEEIVRLIFNMERSVTKYINFVNSLNTENKIIINSVDELNNLENILLSKFEELKNAENG